MRGRDSLCVGHNRKLQDNHAYRKNQGAEQLFFNTHIDMEISGERSESANVLSYRQIS